MSGAFSAQKYIGSIRNGQVQQLSESRELESTDKGKEEAKESC